MLAIYFLISAVFVGIDQWVKFLVVNQIDYKETRNFIPGVLSLTQIHNTGAAWSIFEGQMWFFFIVTIVACVVITYLLIKYQREFWLFPLGLALVLAGALGNFIDRIRLGYVVDMFQTEFMTFPIFNVADVSLFIGVACIFIYTLFEERLKGTKHGKSN